MQNNKNGAGSHQVHTVRNGKKGAGSLIRYSRTDRYLQWVLLLVLAVVPLVIHFRSVEYVAPRFLVNIYNSGVKTDMFNHDRWVLLMVAALAVVVLLLIRTAAEKIPLVNSRLNVPLALLGLLVLMSAVFAQYPHLALIGMYNRYEGALAFGCYYLLMLAAMNMRIRPRFADALIAVFALIAGINMVLGLANFLGHDLLRTSFVKGWIGASGVSFAQKAYFCTLFNNPNFASGIGAAFTGFFLVLAMLRRDSRWRLACILFALAAFCVVLTAKSSGGFVALACAVPVILLIAVFAKGWKETGKALVGFVILASVVFAALNQYDPGVMGQMTGAVRQFAWNDRNETVRSGPDGNAAPGKAPGLDQKVVQGVPVVTDVRMPEPAVTRGTGRLYIWEKTISMIGQKPWLGHGPDTIVYYFPQSDLYKIANLGSNEEYVDKPHNHYIALAFNSGIPALLAMLWLFGVYIADSVRKWGVRLPQGDEAALPAAVFVFCVTFMVQWLFNDSTIGTAIIFWIMLGMGGALNLSAE